jgi:hypothetical protein
MKKERKEALMYAFPPVPAKIQRKMEIGKRAQNFCVFLTRGVELFVRCFHRYYGGELKECNRYVFAKDGCARYIYYGESGHGDRWRVTKYFREPTFFAPGWFTGFRDNTYVMYNVDAYRESELKYCELGSFNTVAPLEYLRIYVRHPNIEYLVKSGYHHLIRTDYNGWNYQIPTVRIDNLVNLKSNNLLKMLDLNRVEFQLLQGHERYYEQFIFCRLQFPKNKPEDVLMIAQVYGYACNRLQDHCALTGLSPLRLVRYLLNHDVNHGLYHDYLDQCTQLGYDLHDTAINMPRVFHTMHERISALIEVKKTAKLQNIFEENYSKRLCYEYSEDDLIARQPKSIDEIAEEGAALKHCVGGYAERHAKNQTTIMFLRKADNPDTPYYTMEINSNGRIQQCYGYRNNTANNPKPPEIKTFEKHYEQYLQEVIHGKRNHRAARQSA